MNRLKQIIFIITCMLMTSITLADNGSAGKFVVKGKIIGVLNRYKASKSIAGNIGTQITNADTTNSQKYQSTTVSAGTSVNMQLPYQLNNTLTYGSGYGVAASGAYFFTDHLALELGVAYIQKKIKLNGTFDEIGCQNNSLCLSTGYNGVYSTQTISKLIPVDFIAQYHFAPYGKVSPYLGLGYNYTLASASAGSKLGSSRGVVFQAGVDSYVYNDVLINVDLKKTTLKTKLNFSASSANYGNFILPSQKLQLNPTTLTIGIGYRF